MVTIRDEARSNTFSPPKEKGGYEWDVLDVVADDQVEMFEVWTEKYHERGEYQSYKSKP